MRCQKDLLPEGVHQMWSFFTNFESKVGIGIAFESKFNSQLKNFVMEIYCVYILPIFSAPVNR